MSQILRLSKKGLLTMLFFLSFLSLTAQPGSECYKPLAGIGKTATPVQAGVLCVGCTYITNLSNVTDADKTNFADYNVALGVLAGNGISVADAVNTYPAGWHAGYVVDLGGADLLTASILSSFTLQTFNNGILQETKTNGTGLFVSLLSGTAGKIYLNFQTTLAFDEVRFVFNSVVGGFSTFRVYYATAFAPDCGTSFSAGYCYKQIGGTASSVNFNGGLLNALVTLTNSNNIIDGNKTTFGTLTVPVATPLLSEPVYVGVLDEQLVYPAGNKAGFVIGYSASLLSAGVLNSMSIQTYLHGVLQESVNLGSGGGVSIAALSSAGTDQKEVSITTTKAFNEVRLVTDNTLGVNIGAINIYYAFESGPACTDCKQVLTSNQSSPYTGSIDAARTGAFGVVCVGQSMAGTGNVVDANLTNFATYVPAILSVGCGGQIAVQNDGPDLPANTFAGFAISRQATLLDLGILNAITINLYRNGNFSENLTGAGLISAGLLNPTTGMTFIGMKSTQPFDEVQIVFDASLISVALGGTYNIYYAYVVRDDDNDGVADCVELCGSANDAIDTDHDGIPNACDACNSINAKSSIVDTDGDGVVNACDADSDNDGIADGVEDANGDGDPTNDDFDDDGVPNYLDLDSDNDGINDINESGLSAATIALLDADNNGVIDGSVAKGTNGMANSIETNDTGAATINYTLKNTDGDANADYLDLDSDNDGINDIIESGYTGLTDTNNDGVVDGPDADGDGIQDSADGNDALFGDAANPLPKDTDGDGVADFRDLDSDNDSINDIIESAQPGLLDADNNGVVDGPDTDSDGIMDSADGNDALFGDAADPGVVDTDGDGVADFRDLDSDNDAVGDMVESGQPGLIDADNDGVVDGPDADGDGIVDSADGNDALFGDAADPGVVDTDTDGIPDYKDLDSDADGIKDIVEGGHGSLDGNNDGTIDSPSDPDGDGIANNGGLDTKPGDFGGILSASALPLNSIVLSSTTIGSNIQLKWVTASEINISRFLIERSVNGRNFETAGEKLAKGNTSAATAYDALDNISAMSNIPVIFYRIKVVDVDDKFSYSNTIAIRLQKQSAIQVWPNPFGNQLNLHVEQTAGSVLEVRIYNLTGKLLLSKQQRTTTGINTIQLTDNLSKLSGGMYIIELFSNKQKIYSKTIMKQ